MSLIGERVMPSEAYRNEAIRVVRTIPWCMPPAKEITDALGNGIEPDLTKAVLIIKSDESIPSPSMVSPMGGKISKVGGDWIDTLKAADESIHRETTLNRVPVAEGRPLTLVIDGKYSYRYRMNSSIPDYSAERDVSIVSMQVLHPSLAKAHPTNPNSKIEKVVTLTIDQLEKAHQTGILNADGDLFKMIESCALPLSNKIAIHLDDQQKRNLAFTNLTHFLRKTEVTLRSRIIEKVKSKLDKKSGLRNVEHYTLSQMYQDLLATGVSEKQALYLVDRSVKELMVEMYSEHFRQKEARALGKEYKTDEAVRRALGIAAQSFNRLTEYLAEDDGNKKLKRFNRGVEKRAKKLAEEIEWALNDQSSNLGTDVFHLIHLLTKTGINSANTTNLMINMQKFLLDTLVHTSLETEQDPLKVINEVVKTGQNEYGEAIDYKPTIDHGERAFILGKMHDKSVAFISKAFGCSEDHVRRVWVAAKNSVWDLGASIKDQDPNYGIFYQIHDPRNEVINGTIPAMIAHAYRNGEDIVRFEASLTLLFFFKKLFNDAYREKETHSSSAFFAEGIRDYLGSVIRQITIKDKKRGTESLIEVREKDGRIAIVDFHSNKDGTSLDRKSFGTALKDINDIRNRVSIIFIDPKFLADENAEIPFEESVNGANQLLDGLLDFLTNGQKRYQVKVDPKDDRSTFETILGYQNGEDTSVDKLSKKSGSKLNLIARRKVIVKARLDGEEEDCETCEITLYPGVKAPKNLAKLGVLFYGEKREDDSDYAIRRLLEPMFGAIGLSDILSLMQPVDYYPGTAQVRGNYQSGKMEEVQETMLRRVLSLLGGIRRDK